MDQIPAREQRISIMAIYMLGWLACAKFQYKVRNKVDSQTIEGKAEEAYAFIYFLMSMLACDLI